MTLLSALGRDLRFAARAFRREPAFAAGVVATFALAIGANAAMVGLVERLMLAPPPGVRDAERLARVGLMYRPDDACAGRGACEPYTMTSLSYPAFRAIASSGTLAGAAAARTDTMTTGRGESLDRAAVVQATGDWFTVLGVRPALGRLLGPDDDALPAGNDVVVLGHAYWRRRLGGAGDVLGRRLVVDGRALTIVGVAPAGFNGTELSAVDLYVPLSTALRDRGDGWWSEPGMRLVGVVVRLRDGACTERGGCAAPAATAEALAAALREAAASSRDPLAAVALESLVPGRTARESPQARIALWLAGVSLVVLLIATANAAVLFLLRAARRRRDVAVRMALGAGRSALVRQWMVESTLLALGGCAAGLLLSRWLSDLVRATLLPSLAPGDRLADPRVLAASVLAACAAGALAGLAPLAQLGRRAVSAELQAGGGTNASGRFRLQHALVAVQAALCTVLLIGAGLFVRSLDRVRSQDLGFSTARLLHATLDFQAPLRALERDRLHEEAARRVAALPGVTRATVVQGMPFSSHHIPPIHVPGHAGPPNVGGQIPIMYGATPAYLELMDVRLVRGRLFGAGDTRASPLVVLVNETFARAVWPDGDAIGRCVRAGHGPTLGEDPMAEAALQPCRTVVGVVRDSRARSLRLGRHEDRLMQYYVPFEQLPPVPFPDVPVVHGLLVGTTGAPDRLASAVQRVIQGASAVPVYARVRPYQQLIDPQLRSWRLGATLFTAFGALALGIAAVGLFAVVSYLVAQRTREIGVRLALGGTGAGVAGLVVRDAVRMAGGGAALGALVSLGLAPAVQGMLFQTSARSPAIVGGAWALLVAVAVIAAAGPAWRAGRVSPMTVLRGEG